VAPPAFAGPDEEVFHVYDGASTIGPITGTILCRAVILRLAPKKAVVWREGWDDWRPIADVVWELGGIRLPQGDSDAAGPQSVRAVGSRSTLPPGAPRLG
jgi:hypothetical protein